MKYSISIIILFLAFLIACRNEKSSLPVLRFNEEGKFKIVQFTDIHFQINSPGSDSALRIMETVINKENPDLIALTGDVVCSKDTKNAWFALSEVLINAKIPWAVVLGNHDIEYELTGKQIMETIVGLPYNLTINGPEELSGNGNYVLEIKSSGSAETKALLYFLDSHSSFKQRTNAGTYEWIYFDQIQWYREQSRKFTLANNNTPLPALAFFHIPLPEYRDIIYKETTVGIQEELICAPDINTGMYAAIFEMGDVMGTFVGHDHNNNYIGELRNICLSYGAVTGLECYGKIGRGARIIELTEGERKFSTWLYYHDNPRKYPVTYPESFITDSQVKK